MSKQKEAESLYAEIQKAYKPSYFPTMEEKSEAIFNLSAFLYGKNIDKESIIRKAELLGKIHGDHKTKITTLILNRFWETDLDFGVKANKYIDEE